MDLRKVIANAIDDHMEWVIKTQSPLNSMEVANSIHDALNTQLAGTLGDHVVSLDHGWRAELSVKDQDLQVRILNSEKGTIYPQYEVYSASLSVPCIFSFAKPDSEK